MEFYCYNCKALICKECVVQHSIDKHEFERYDEDIIKKSSLIAINMLSHGITKLMNYQEFF